MKEAMPNRERLTNQAQERYSKGGDIFMGAEPGNGEKPLGVEEATRRLEVAAKKGEEARKQASAKEFLKSSEESQTTPEEQPAVASSEGNDGGKKPPEKPRAPSGTEGSGEESGSSGEAQSSSGKSAEKGLTREEKLEILSKKITNPKLIAIKDKILDSLKTSQMLSLSVDEEFMRDQVKQVEKLAKESLIGEDQAKLFHEYLGTLFARESEEYREKMKEIKSLPPKSDKRREEKVMELLEMMNPYSATLDPDFIHEVVQYRKTLDYLVIRVIGQSLDAEESPYRQSFYGGINLDTIKDILKTNGEKGDKESENNYNRTLITSAAAELFHSMNLMIITGKMAGFVDNSESITPEQLQIMQNIKGVSQVMRIFDEEILRLINRDSILNGKNYDEMMGLERDSVTGEIKGWGQGTVEKRFRGMIKAGAVEGFDKDKLDDWEIKWAFHVGKIMTNLSLRTPEQISLSIVQPDDYRMASWPLEKASRLFNWLGLTGLRYGLGDVKGGIFLAKLTRDIFQKQRKEQGYGDCRIKKLGWTDIGDFELAGVCGVNGIWQGWRSNVVLLNQAPTIFSEKEASNESKTIRDSIALAGKYWSKDDKSRNDNNKLLSKEDHIKELKLRGNKLDETLQAESAARLKEVFLKKIVTTDDEEKEKVKFVLNTDRFNNALGIVLKHGILTSSEKDIQVLRDVKEEVRTAIWRSVAKDNPLAIIPYLQGTNLTKEKENAINVTEVKDENGKIVKVGLDIAKGEDKKRWDQFADKLSILHELRIQKLRNGEYESLDDIIASQEGIEKGTTLDGDEKIWLKNIAKYGKDISKDLSNIRFPNIPFMNDAVFERSNYSEAGKNYYGRRAGGDLASFYRLGEAFTALMINPGKVKPNEAFEVISKVIEAIQEPLGTEFAQDRARQFLEAYLIFVEKGGFLGVDINNGIQEEGPGWDIVKFLSRDNVYSAVRKMLRKPTSIAQIISGPNALSFDEVGMRDLLDEVLKGGLTRKPLYDDNGIALYTDLDKKFRKKFRTGFWGMFLAYLRDVPKILIAGMVADIGKQVTKENK